MFAVQSLHQFWMNSYFMAEVYLNLMSDDSEPRTKSCSNVMFELTLRLLSASSGGNVILYV